MKVWARFIHKISQRDEADVMGPFEIPDVRGGTTAYKLARNWRNIRKKVGSPKLSRKFKDRPARSLDGWVYFLRGTNHCLLVMPHGGELHRKNAPPSHFGPGGPFHGVSPNVRELQHLQLDCSPVKVYGDTFHADSRHYALIGMGFVEYTDPSKRRARLTDKGKEMREMLSAGA